MNARGKNPAVQGLFVSFFVLLFIFHPNEAMPTEKTFRNALGMEFVLIPAGSFIMGSPPEEAYRDEREIQHTVTITRPFYMQMTEVTLAQWRAVMGSKMFGRRKGPPDLPVVRVSWYDCVEFLDALNARNQGTYRLPTEAEWEYACRAGTNTAYSWGDTADCTRAMYGNNTLKFGVCVDYITTRGLKPNGPAPVKSYPPNPWGLYDLHGNVWEWCLDRFGAYDPAHSVDPQGPDFGTMRVRRGGSWYKYGYSCRSANRAYAHPASKLRTTGFRIIREVP